MALSEVEFLHSLIGRIEFFGVDIQRHHVWHFQKLNLDTLACHYSLVSELCGHRDTGKWSSERWLLWRIHRSWNISFAGVHRSFQRPELLPRSKYQECPPVTPMSHARHRQSRRLGCELWGRNSKVGHSFWGLRQFQVGRHFGSCSSSWDIPKHTVVTQHAESSGLLAIQPVRSGRSGPVSLQPNLAPPCFHTTPLCCSSILKSDIVKGCLWTACKISIWLGLHCKAHHN